MSAVKARRLIGFLILILSLAILLWGLWPHSSLTEILPLLPSDLSLPTPQGLIPVLAAFV